MNQIKPERTFWNKADTRQVGQMLVGGLFVGVVVRWLVISTPPLPVTASEADHSPGIYSSTNSIFLPARAPEATPPG